MRFEPEYFLERAGLPSFNCSVQNCRPTDAYAFASYLFSRAPDVKLDCVFAVQTATFADAPLHPGLLYDERLSAAFPGELGRAAEGAHRKTGGQGGPRPQPDHRPRPRRPQLLRHPPWQARLLLQPAPGQLHQAAAAQVRLERGRPERHDRVRTSRRRCASSTRTASCRPWSSCRTILARCAPSRRWAFEKKMAGLRAYLRDARTRCDFRVLDLLTVSSFGGRTALVLRRRARDQGEREAHRAPRAAHAARLLPLTRRAVRITLTG